MIDNTKLLLYGAASIGKIAKEILEKQGFDVIGFIDKRAYEMESYCGLPVWDIEEIEESYKLYMVYVSVKNVFEHSTIANKLRVNGFQRIIYKPYSTLMNYATEKETVISNVYDAMFEGEMKCEQLNSGDLFEIDNGIREKDFAIIFNDGISVTAFVPTQMVFTNNYREGGMKKWGNVPIIGLFTHLSFFRYLNGDDRFDYNDYLEQYCCYTALLSKTIDITSSWKKNVIRNRTQVYEEMRNSLDLDPDFFVRNAATAEWNEESGYFNLTSGKHRSAFQVAIGKHYIPLKMRMEDYESFLNIAKLERVNRLLEACEDEFLIEHPYFYRGSNRKDGRCVDKLTEYVGLVASKIYKDLDRVDFSSITVIDETEKNYGYVSRFFARLGCVVYKVESKGELEDAINNLFRIHSIIYNSKVKFECANLIIHKDYSMEYV